MQTSVILSILLELLEKPLLKAEYFSKKHSVSVRTIYRYINVLIGSGVPVVPRFGRKGGITLPDDYKYRFISNSSAPDAKVHVLEQAITNNLIIKITYSDRGRVTDRIIEPYNIILADNVWQIYSYCRMRCTFRLFKLNNITNIFIQDKVFTPRKLPPLNIN